ncbi:MAG: hypothetical protein LIO93_00065 [Bacteroidales bacterium]|nr:hypothetical protein [Bacteroidales bacterium]
MNKRIVVIGLLMFLLLNMAYSQQVGINTNEPNSLTVLDIQNAAGDNGVIEPKGIMVPRLTEEQRNAIDVSNPELANSLLIYNTDEDCFNFYSRTESRWKSVCGDESGVSVVTDANCSLMRINGAYQAGTSLTSSNYIQIPVVVSKSGSYDVRATPETDNGYFFFASGVFLSAGSSVLTVPGLGTPINGQTDNIILSINGTSFCNQSLLVSPSVVTPDYTIDCTQLQAANITGRYVSGQAITEGQNTILVTIEATDEAIGSTYEIETEQINGYYFHGRGVITQNEQRVTLSAQGTPINAGVDTFQLRTNGGGTAPLCSFQVRVATRPITILGVGENNTYYLGSENNGMNLLLNNQNLFGPNQTSPAPVGSFNILRPGTGNNVNLANYITSQNPDIIIIQYNWIAGSYGASNLQALTDFVNNNGVLILCSDGGGLNGPRNIRCENIVNSIFDGASFQHTALENDNTQLMPTISDAPVLDGPFMNLRGLSIGHDSGNNFNFTNLSDEAAVIANSTAGNARAFMHKTKGFIFIGDGAPFSYAPGNTEPYNYPMKLDSNFNPIPNTYSNPDTYNSYLFCNIMAWATQYVQQNKPR